jgi:hypothetical protein
MPANSSACEQLATGATTPPEVVAAFKAVLGFDSNKPEQLMATAVTPARVLVAAEWEDAASHLMTLTTIAGRYRANEDEHIYVPLNYWKCIERAFVNISKITYVNPVAYHTNPGHVLPYDVDLSMVHLILNDRGMLDDEPPERHRKSPYLATSGLRYLKKITDYTESDDIRI